MRKRLSNSRDKGLNLMRYILRDTGDNPRGFFNSKTQEERKFFAEVEALMFRSTYLEIPISHFVISFPEKEKRKAFENAREIAFKFLKKMSMEDALSAFGAHTDSDYFHIHVGANMIDVFSKKSLNQEGLVRQVMEATSELCREFDFTSPLNDYRMVLLGIKACFKSGDWDTIHETLETMSSQIENNSDKNGYVLKTGRWETELGTITGFPSAARYFDQMGPVPPRPKNTPPAKPNFWVMKKAAQSRIYKEKRKITEDFDKKLSVAEMYARCRFDEEKAWVRIPDKLTSDSTGNRPPVPAETDQRIGAKRCW
ncbi:hypothetical protein H4684_004031, partial [Desulfomicrobium macestii]